MKEQDLQTIRGYIIALPRVQGKEDTCRVAVVADDGTEYTILHKGVGTNLAAHVSADVEISGRIASPAPTQAEDDDKQVILFSVHKYTLADGYDDPWYDDAIE